MSIRQPSEMEGMKKVSEVVGIVLREMIKYASPGMTAKALDDFGGLIMKQFGAQSAPQLAYKFPGFTCISVNEEIAHGIPYSSKVLKEGDLVNVDVSAELDGYWADNGCSFVLGEDINNQQHLVNASRDILTKAINNIKGGVRISSIGKLIEDEAKKKGYKVIRNLAGHGVGLSLHEEPEEILNCYDRFNIRRFKKNSVVAIETFISTKSTFALKTRDGWTLVGNKGGFVAQHEHTIVVTDDKPIILTEMNGI
ncbi:type I methionyl aminopeptidase [Chondrinema litorale]|uniref:type I methionyl aminopeptidase n=1 Tax=Chondrinema litorale TaxID=2994555 RepID=UPI0025436843|nr:type I methionyl aminopeptidase [Chondrinema litorale]UZR97263.1 type I methionyl aminopeptidase [Chondrinema litorale]